MAPVSELNVFMSSSASALAASKAQHGRVAAVLVRRTWSRQGRLRSHVCLPLAVENCLVHEVHERFGIMVMRHDGLHRYLSRDAIARDDIFVAHRIMKDGCLTVGQMLDDYIQG